MNAAISRRPAGMRGLTLVELLAVVAIVAILLGGAGPSLADLLASMRVTAAANDFLAGLFLARSEAAKRNARVVMCKSADGETCTAADDWDQGWILFHDVDNDASRSPGEPVIWREARAGAGIKVAGNASVAKYVSFDPAGGTKLANGAFQAGAVTVCRRGVANAKGRKIVLNAAGRPRVQTLPIAAC